jgi:hypothetical protein
MLFGAKAGQVVDKHLRVRALHRRRVRRGCCSD